MISSPRLTTTVRYKYALGCWFDMFVLAPSFARHTARTRLLQPQALLTRAQCTVTSGPILTMQHLPETQQAMWDSAAAAHDTQLAAVLQEPVSAASVAALGARLRAGLLQPAREVPYAAVQLTTPVTAIAKVLLRDLFASHKRFIDFAVTHCEQTCSFSDPLSRWQVCAECIYGAHPLVKDTVTQLQAQFLGLHVCAERLRWCEKSGGPELWFTITADIPVPVMWR